MTGRVVIIGAGAVGIATALSAAEQGLEVDVIDRDAPASGASHGNAGVISPWSCVPVSLPGLWRSVPRWLFDPEGPLSVRPAYALRFAPWALRFLAAGREARLPAIADAMHALSRPSADLYRQMLSGTGSEHLVVDSLYLHVSRRETVSLDGPAWRLRAARGVPFRQVGAEELREIEPALAPEYRSAVVIEGQARSLDPGGVGRALAAKAEGFGVRFHRTAVTALAREGEDWTVSTEAGAHRARQVVLAAGAWSARLLRPLGIRVPLEAERGYHLVLKSPGVEVRNSVMETERKFVASGMAAGVRLAGTAEFAGLDAAPDWRRAEVLKGHAERLFPGIATGDAEVWMGSRPSLPDSLPCIGPVPGQPGLVVAFGHSHFGFGMAPATGRLVAQLLRGIAPNVDMAPYRVERFA
ncbi:MAG: FAD-dependent oxidoreductase [Pseudomonadota bacterium]